MDGLAVPNEVDCWCRHVGGCCTQQLFVSEFIDYVSNDAEFSVLVHEKKKGNKLGNKFSRVGSSRGAPKTENVRDLATSM